ncbi:MAG TPA: hemolysin family protein, partial [Actinomycetota bacterium]|nr:hemolysin family protein [Actinomycetota bacterium]
MNLWLLVLTAGLLIMNGVFVGAEFALTGARRTRIEALREQGDRRAGIALKSMRELPMMLAGAQLGITMASLGLGHVAEPAFAHLFERLFGPVGAPSGLSHTLSYVVALIVVVYLHMVIGEMAPKNLTIAEPERSALWLALPTRAFVTVFRPFVHLLNGLARLGLRALRVEPAEELLTAHSADEIARLIEEAAGEGMLGIEKHRLLSGALELSERDAAAAMVPRTEMVAASVTATPADLERLVLETGHSRIPIYGKDIDHVFGF